MKKSGIYQFEFQDGSKYIGKSVDVERRQDEHVKYMLYGEAPWLIQEAYNRWGMPKFSVLEYCHPDHLGLLEAAYIELVKPQLNTVKYRVEDADSVLANAHMLKQSTSSLIQEIHQLRLKSNNDHQDYLLAKACEDRDYWHNRWVEESTNTLWKKLFGGKKHR